MHPIGAKETRALRRLQREASTTSPYVFVSERGATLSVAGYQRKAAQIARLGRNSMHSFYLIGMSSGPVV